MADVDTFPMRKSLLAPIIQYPKKKVWIYQYDRTIQLEYTFAMSFTAMRSQTWNETMHFVNSTNDLMKIFSEKIKLQNHGAWNYDQLIMTRAILESRICGLPPKHSLWKLLNMDPIILGDKFENKFCFHGKKLYDCNKESTFKGCPYWHFYPTERKKELTQKYNEIIVKHRGGDFAFTTA